MGEKIISVESSVESAVFLLFHWKPVHIKLSVPVALLQLINVYMMFEGVWLHLSISAAVVWQNRHHALLVSPQVTQAVRLLKCHTAN